MFGLLTPYIETAFFTTIFMFVGLYFNANDPLFIKNIIPLFTILIIFTTLFFGARKGFLTIVMTAPIIYYFYHEDMVTLLLTNIFLVLVLGQFFHYWHIKYQKEKHTSRYTNEKLNELSNAFYALKISHDTLEKSYAIKPHSIRSAMKNIENTSFKKNRHYKDFLHIISTIYSIDGITLTLHNNGKFKSVCSTKNSKKVDIKDKLIQKTIDSKESSYISDLKIDTDSNYIATIAAKDSRGDLTAILTIEKLSISDFNQNSIVSLSILLSYFMDRVHLHKKLQASDKTLSKEDIFSFEFNRVLNLKKEHKIDSSVILFKCSNELISKQLKAGIDKELKGIDSYLYAKVKVNYIFIILLPITPIEATQSIIEKITSIQGVDQKQFEQMSFGVQEGDLMHEYAVMDIITKPTTPNTPYYKKIG